MRSTYMITDKGCNRSHAAGVLKSLWAGVLALGLGSTVAFGGVPQACPAGAASPTGCTSNGSGAGIDTLTVSAQHGDKVCFTVAIFNTCSTCCDVAGVNTTLFIGDPDGPGGSAAATSYPITSGAYLERGADFICPSADLRCVTAGNCTIPGQIGYEYIVAHSDEHGETGDSCPPDPAAGTGQVSAYAQGAGTLCRAIPVGASLCKALAIDIPHGACCDPCTGECVDGVGASECVAPDTFSLGMTCAQVICTPADCDDNDACTADSCNATTGLCEHGPRTVCNDDDACTEDSCSATTGQCVFTPNVTCNDNNACTRDRCVPATGQCEYTPSVTCNDNDACTADSCNTTTGQCEYGPPRVCNDNNTCTNDRCDAQTGDCVFTDNDTCHGLSGCRITGGRTVLDGQIVADPDGVAIVRGQGGGQVGAPCGCIGCFDTFDHIQGQWQYSRKNKQGTFHARDFNSLICGCDATAPECNNLGVAGSGIITASNFTGDLCNPGDPVPGPEPRHSPANVACFSGIGGWTATNGRREIQVAFRVEVEDRGEPAVGRNSDDTCDVYQIRIWLPRTGETAASLADQVCCIDGHATIRSDVRAPDIQDGGNLVHGNLQIHPMLPNTQDGTCPVPHGSCQE